MIGDPEPPFESADRMRAWTQLMMKAVATLADAEELAGPSWGRALGAALLREHGTQVFAYDDPLAGVSNATIELRLEEAGRLLRTIWEDINGRGATPPPDAA